MFYEGSKVPCGVVYGRRIAGGSITLVMFTISPGVVVVGGRGGVVPCHLDNNDNNDPFPANNGEPPSRADDGSVAAPRAAQLTNTY